MKVKLDIRRRLTLIVLSTGLIALLVLGGVAFYGMNGVRNLALKSSEELGVRSALNSSTTLEMQQKKELSLLAGDKATVINQQMSTLALEVKKIADQMTYIQSNPNVFALQDVEVGDSGDVAFYVQRAPDALFSRAELGLTANIRDFLIRAVETNEPVMSMSVASRQKFTLTAADKRLLSIEPPIFFDALTVDWYRRAVNERTLIFTDVQAGADRKALEIFCAAPYFNADGELAGVVSARTSLEKIAGVVNEVTLRDAGFCFLLDNRGRAIIATDRKIPSDNQSELAVGLGVDVRSSDNLALADVASQMVDGFKGIRSARIDGKTYLIAYAPIERTDWSFAVAFDESEVLDPIVENAELIKSLTQKSIAVLDDHIQTTMIFFGAFIIIQLLATAYVGRRLADHFVEPIEQLSEGVRDIARGSLDKKLSIKTGDEIESLAITFNVMTDRLRSYVENLKKSTAEREHIETELGVASNIQQAMLPREFDLGRSEVELFATMQAAKEVGGDFYDFYLLEGDRLVVTIADVSGKGVPAALFMVISQTVLKNFVLTASDLASAVGQANYRLSQNNDELMFVTVFAAVLELRTGRLVYVNAGHNPPLIRRAGRFEYLRSEEGCALGIDEDQNYRQASLTLEAGDVLFLYTDGVTEAMNSDGEQYSEERLIERLNATDDRATAEEILTAVGDDVKAHVDGAAQSDDITMLAVRFNALDGGADKL